MQAIYYLSMAYSYKAANLIPSRKGQNNPKSIKIVGIQIAFYSLPVCVVEVRTPCQKPGIAGLHSAGSSPRKFAPSSHPSGLMVSIQHQPAFFEMLGCKTRCGGFGGFE